MTRQFRLGSPVAWMTSCFLLQFGFWLFFFPNVPSVLDGEARETDLLSLAMLMLVFVGIASGLILGFHGRLSIHQPSVLKYRSTIIFAIILHAISASAMAIQVGPVLFDPTRLLLMFEAAGINRQAAELREATLGIPTLGTLWIASFALYMSALKLRFTKVAFFLTIFMLFSVFTYGTLMMSRTHVVTSFLMILGSQIAFWPSKLSMKRIVVVIFSLVLVVWGNSLIRTGILYSSQNDVALMSLEVQYVLLQEFVEKYLAGEFNNSLIIATYPADPSRNFLYGTMFSSFAESYMPDRHLNTLNILGYYYWQFGLLGAIFFGAMIGFVIGFLSKNGLRFADLGANYYTLMFLVLFPGFFQSTRIQYFFLHYTLVPALIFSLFFGALLILPRTSVRRYGSDA